MSEFKDGPMTFKSVDCVLIEAKHYLDKCCNYITNKEENFQDPDVVTELTRLLKHFMITSFSVLDYAYYYLFCQNESNGQHPHPSKVQKLSTPIKPSLNYSELPQREETCKKTRDKWAKECTTYILGGSNKNFQDNLLSFQVMTQVGGSGMAIKQATGDNRQPEQLVVAFKDGEYWTPINVHEEEARNWSAATAINVLHFYRNFVVHRDFIDIIKFPDDLEGQESRNKLQISVPDLRHTRTLPGSESDEPEPIQFRLKPLANVLEAIYDAVQKQKQYLQYFEKNAM